MSNLTTDQLAEAYIAEQTLEHTRRYILEGRHYADCSDEEVSSLWVVTLRDLASTNFSQEFQWAALLDIEAELGLRRIAKPVDQVQPELALFAKHIEGLEPHGPADLAACAEVRAELADLRERLNRPKH
jgi:hypothetical protein